MKCHEIMTPDPMRCTPEDNVAVAINLMWDHDCGAVPVVKDRTSNELVGMVTDRDIAMHVVKHACAHPSQARVGDCMTTAVVVCQIEDLVERAIQLMGENRIRRIPIVDANGCCVGIISQADLLSRAADNIEAIVTVLQQVSIPHRKPEASVSEANSKKEETVEIAATAEPPAAEKTEDKPDVAEKTEDKPPAAEKTATAAKQGDIEKKKN